MDGGVAEASLSGGGGGGGGGGGPGVGGATIPAAAGIGSGALLSAADDDDDEPILAAGPAKALAAAQCQEGARVKLYRAMITLLHVLQDLRGFRITVVGDKNVKDAAEAAAVVETYAATEKALAAELDKELIMEAEVPEKPKPGTTAWAQGLKPGTRLIVCVMGSGNTDTMRQIVDWMDTEGIDIFLLLSRGSLTAYSKKYLESCGKRVEAFSLTQLQAPIDLNCMVPKHVPLNEEERQRVKRRYPTGILPRLLVDDPMVALLGLRRGDMVAVKEGTGVTQPTDTIFEIVAV